MSSPLNFLGLTARAGCVISGEEVVLRAMQQHRVHLVLLAEDASPNTKKKMGDKCSTYNVPLCESAPRTELGRAIGKEQRVTLGITDAGFAAKLKQLHEQ
ncbi:ribosomal protein L7Ae-like RNA K-turn-binding protein [Salsuginibacillus halophilus]|uniref:Ribosomal protein L7Ae-like RNA K-turn-binding protein n=1 Tax=Salsuginibacillus halophilus TaxID=517424 RepID=A0A2P8HYD9_9BACI|nr:YlxQ family RNA-binding protein [Salsuginibacillus halophilus]PSL51230.1 ribosomal protein L7Ae-like RNA K-turn-binding protein [Salsuginibacillus halophilus]